MKTEIKDRIKNALAVENIKREAINTVCVAVGVAGATFIDRLVQKGIDKFWPTPPEWIKYAKPFGPILTGFGLSLFAPAGTQGDPLRYIGYGVSGAGVVSGLRLIPQFDSLMSGTSDQQTVNGINGLLGLALGEFGTTDNIKEISTVDAQATTLELPDLGCTMKAEPVNYSTSQYDGADDFEEVIAEVI